MPMREGIGAARAGISILLLLGSMLALGPLAGNAAAIPPCGWYVGRCIEDSTDSDCRVTVDRNLFSVSCAAGGKRYTVYAGNPQNPGKNQAKCTVDIPEVDRPSSDRVLPPYDCAFPILRSVAVTGPPDVDAAAA